MVCYGVACSVVECNLGSIVLYSEKVVELRGVDCSSVAEC